MSVGLHIPFRWQVAALPALSCLGVAAVTAAIVVHIVTGRMANESGREVAAIAAEMADRLSREMAARGTEVQLLSHLRSSQDAVAPARLRAQIEALRRSVPFYSWIGFVRADGIIEASTDGLLEGVDGSARPVFRNGLQGLWFGDVHPAVVLARHLGRPGEPPLEFVDVAVPVRDARQEVVGVLAAHLGWSWAGVVQQQVLVPRRDRRQIEVMVVSASSSVLLGPQRMLGRPLGFDPARLPRQPGSWGLHDWPDGTRAVTAVAESRAHGVFPGLGWRVIVRQPLDVVVAEARTLGGQIMAWGGAVALAFLGLGLWLAGRVAQPVSQMLQTSSRLRHAPSGLAGGRRESDVRWVSELLRSMDEDLDTRARQVRQLKYDATHDPLTHLPNRAFLSELLAQVHPPGGRRDHEVLLLGFDLDGFKLVNDSHGHAAGDAVLQAVAARLTATLRDGDVAVRMGGDEFLVLIEVPAGQGDTLADEVASRLVQAVAEPIMHGGQGLSVGCSIGIAVWRSRGAVTLQDALGVVDRAMYQAKAQGKGRWVRLPLVPEEAVA